MTHNIKINHRFVEDILNGNKRFEIRNNDRAYQKGDKIKFIVVRDGTGATYNDNKDLIQMDMAMEEWSKCKELQDMTFEISFVISGWGLEKDYVAFGIKETTDG